MQLLQFLFTTLATIQVYYMYKFIYSIPLKYEIPETENDVDIRGLLRGINGTSHETRTQKHQLLQHLEQTKSDNNTASIYTLLTNLDVVDQF